MGRPKEYTPEKLEKAVKRYFKTISREITVMESKATGKRDKMGHMIYEEKPVLNSLGKEMKDIQYLIPPSVGGLSEFLGIHRDTWNDYCNHEKHPEFSDTTTYAQGRIHAYLERESLTRSGKDLKGVLFNLENNFGYKERVEVTNDTMEQFLRKQGSEDPEGQGF